MANEYFRWYNHSILYQTYKHFFWHALLWVFVNSTSFCISIGVGAVYYSICFDMRKRMSFKPFFFLNFQKFVFLTLILPSTIQYCSVLYNTKNLALDKHRTCQALLEQINARKAEVLNYYRIEKKRKEALVSLVK